jgi:hypothetical protein
LGPLCRPGGPVGPCVGLVVIFCISRSISDVQHMRTQISVSGLPCLPYGAMEFRNSCLELCRGTGSLPTPLHFYWEETVLPQRVLHSFFGKYAVLFDCTCEVQSCWLGSLVRELSNCICENYLLWSFCFFFANKEAGILPNQSLFLCAHC